MCGLIDSPVSSSSASSQNPNVDDERKHEDASVNADLAVELMSTVWQQSQSTVRVHTALAITWQQLVSSHYTNCQQRQFTVIAQRQTHRAAVLFLYPAEHLLVA